MSFAAGKVYDSIVGSAFQNHASRAHPCRCRPRGCAGDVAAGPTARLCRQRLLCINECAAAGNGLTAARGMPTYHHSTSTVLNEGHVPCYKDENLNSRLLTNSITSSSSRQLSSVRQCGK
eukprot:2202600-Pleurochrysis_carterae.AAC.1